MLSTARLYAILDLGYVPEESAEKVTASLLAGGADLLQLRAKNHDLETIERIARRLIPICRAAGVPFILNDYPVLAATLDADGVHIGQDDGSLAHARRAVESERGIHSAVDRGIHSGLHSFIHSSSSPRPFLFGRSTHSLDQARAALAEGFDYIGFGPLFSTPTKVGRPAIGLADIALMEDGVGKNIPAFCIGGITPQTLDQVLAAGARQVVVVSSLLQAPDIESATRQIKTRIDAC